MKAAVIIGMAVAVGALGHYFVYRENETHGSHKTYHSHPADPPTTTHTDPTDIFQKAFWKRPTPDDKILHAERREWADAQGLQRWQWFIVVEPSAALVKHLREDNAFSLTPAASLPEIADAPPWFATSPGEFECLHAPQGRMRLCFDKSRRLLHATDSGGGFHRGAAPPETPVPATPSSTGRLPRTPPPTEVPTDVLE